MPESTPWMPSAPRKRFAQHFLHDRTVIDRILACIDPRPGDHVVEIGPGRGALTTPLLDRVGSLDVVELDRDLAAFLETQFPGDGRLRIHVADALRFDFAALDVEGKRLRVVGNLPYNISTPLLFHLLAQKRHIADMHFMLQQEVVDRIVAGAGDRAYGRLSVTTQYHCLVEKLFTVGQGAFHPAPRVRSAVLRLIVRPAPAVAVEDEQRFNEIVKVAFSHRRKTLRNALSGLLDETRIRTAGLDPATRPGMVDLAGFAALANESGPLT